jgi:uncharacterized protein (DUF1015 family)
MNTLVKPFAALRPEAEHAAAVVAPPYDVVSADEARELADGRPNSFLHISRPEIDLPADTDPYSDAVYKTGAENLERLSALGLLIRDPSPGYYVYRMRMGEHEQTGIAVTASVAAYEANRVRKHELTRPDKETDRVRNIDALNAQTGPVLSVYRANAAVKAMLEAAKTKPPVVDVVGQHDVTHSIWRIDDETTVTALTDAFEAMDAIYIADGHHRSAAASRVAAERGSSGEHPTNADFFLTVVFPHDEVNILDYNRTVADLNGLSPDSFLEQLNERFILEPADTAIKPTERQSFGMYVAGNWYRLRIRDEHVPADDPVARLDVSLLQNQLLNPVLNVGDPRLDPRIAFVGGIRGLGELEQRVDSGEAAVAFSLYPTSMEQLMDVADAEKLMPPKSTWFEPKLADGLLTHVLD